MTPHIFEGIWVNRDTTTLTGATLTLSESHGAILISFLAIFVSAVGQYFWSLICFVVHQLRVRRKPQDGFEYQQQLVLRNTHMPTTALWEFLAIAFSWRRRAVRPYTRSISLVLLAAICFGGWTTAGILSAKFLLPIQQSALIKSPSCGIYTSEIVQSGRDIYTRLARLAQDYAQRCYDNLVESPELGCSHFVSPYLGSTSHSDAECPFNHTLCVRGKSGAFRMETDLLDSHQDLGMNAMKRDRINYRKMTSCAPLDLDRYTTIDNNSFTGQILQSYSLGRYIGINMTESNITYQASLEGAEGYYFVSIGTGNPFFVPGTNLKYDVRFEPIKELRRDDAVVTLAFLSHNGVFYDSPIDDPLFSSHIPYNRTKNIVSWFRDHPITVLGCTEQYQICNPDSAHTPLCSDPGRPDLSPKQIQTLVDKLNLNERQASVAMLFLSMASMFSISNVIFGLGAGVLRAQYTLAADNGNTALPDNQWMIESRNLFNITLAGLQQTFVRYADSRFRQGDGWQLAEPNPEYFYRETCGFQKVKALSSHKSFSFLGLIVTICIGSFIILVSLTLEPLTGYIRKRKRWDLYRYSWWIIDGKLQLGRLVQETSGFGDWERCGNEIPVTKRGHLMGVVIPIKDHPTLGYHSLNSPSLSENNPQEEFGLIDLNQP